MDCKPAHIIYLKMHLKCIRHSDHHACCLSIAGVQQHHRNCSRVTKSVLSLSTEVHGLHEQVSLSRHAPDEKSPIGKTMGAAEGVVVRLGSSLLLKNSSQKSNSI